ARAGARSGPRGQRGHPPAGVDRARRGAPRLPGRDRPAGGAGGSGRLVARATGVVVTAPAGPPGGPGARKIPVMVPFLGEEEARAAADAVRSGWVAQGPRVAEFERAFASAVGAGHGIAVSSCTTALHLSLVLRGRYDRVRPPGRRGRTDRGLVVPPAQGDHDR